MMLSATKVDLRNKILRFRRKADITLSGPTFKKLFSDYLFVLEFSETLNLVYLVCLTGS